MEKSKKYEWYKIAANNDELIFPSKGLLQITVNNKTICLAKVGDKLFGCASKCPHAGGMIADGFMDALNNVVCPLHRYKFSLQNGRNVSGEGYFLKTYPIDQREDGLYVGIEITGFLSWL